MRLFSALLLALSSGMVVACGDAAPAAENEAAADELNLFQARRFDVKPGTYVGKSVRIALLQRGDKLVANVSTSGDTFGGSGPVNLNLSVFFFNNGKGTVDSKSADGDRAPALSLELVANGANLDVSGKISTSPVRETLIFRPLSEWAGTFRNPETNETLRIESPTELGATLTTAGGTDTLRWRDRGVALQTKGDGELGLLEGGIYWYGTAVWLRQ